MRGATCQGYKDDSCWARGQAWGVYGTAISYRYTRRPEYLDAFRRVLAYYLERLPEDLVPYWDMTFTSGTEATRLLLRVHRGLRPAGAAKVRRHRRGLPVHELAAQMLGSVAAHYAVKEGRRASALLRHGTYSKKPYNTCTPEGVDECTSWGDYFYMEALTRLTKLGAVLVMKLHTKSDFTALMHRFLDPLLPLYSEGGARHLGDTGVTYPGRTIEMETFSARCGRWPRSGRAAAGRMTSCASTAGSGQRHRPREPRILGRPERL